MGQENSLLQTIDYNKYYNLDFDVENNDVRAWTLGANITSSHVGVSKDKSHSRLPLQIYQILYQGRRQKFQINLCNQDKLLLPAESFLGRMTLIRNLDSNYYNETFSVFSPKNRTDAFIFIRNSKPSNHLPGVYNTGFDLNTFMINKISKIEGKYQSRFNGLPNILDTYEVK